VNIELHIEELVLRGFDPARGHAIRDAVESELARMLVDHEIPIKEDANSSIVTAPPTVLAGFRAADWGRQIAGSILLSMSHGDQSIARDSRRTD
jgi:hypothetical protein